MNWSYVAGFFDGEGSITSVQKKRHRISITQTNREVLENVCDFTGVGRVMEITKRKNHWKDSWLYYISKQEDILKFLKSALPELIVKKKLAKKSIKELEQILRTSKLQKEKLQIRIRKAKKLRKKGLSYRAIGKELRIDFGHARRLVLRDN